MTCVGHLKGVDCLEQPLVCVPGLPLPEFVEEEAKPILPLKEEVKEEKINVVSEAQCSQPNIQDSE